jgi:dihydroflavonol-4-reductase
MDEIKRVLITGASGYLGLHVLKEFLQNGHKVRVAMRNLNDTSKIESIKNAVLNEQNQNQLEFVQADLVKHDEWPKAVKDCNIIMHVATPWIRGKGHIAKDKQDNG